MDIEKFRKRGYETVDRICKYYQELENYNGKFVFLIFFLRCKINLVQKKKKNNGQKSKIF